MSEENAQNTGFVEQSIQTINDPRTYFSEMPVSGGFAAPVVKALIYGLIAGLISFLWDLFGFSVTGGLDKLLGSGAGLMIIIMSVIGALIGLFIGGLILLVISAICGGNTDYEANVRVTASLMVLSPVTAAFGFLYAISFTLGSVVSLLINLFGVWLLFHALSHSLKAKPGSIKVVAIVIGALYLIFFFVGLGTAKLADKYTNMIGNSSNEELMEMGKNLAKEMVDEESGEEIDAAYAEAMEGKEGYHLEMAVGTEIESPSNMQLMESVMNLGEDNDFCILSSEAGFLQTIYTEDGFVLQYKDNSGHFEATQPLERAEIITIFATYLNGVESWKNATAWQVIQ